MTNVLNPEPNGGTRPAVSGHNPHVLRALALEKLKAESESPETASDGEEDDM